MDESGVYAIARSIWDDEWFEDEPYTEREAWMWLLGNAAWKEVKRKGNTGRVVTLNRAEFSVAIRFLQKKWRWENKDRVHRFLKRLEKRDAIRDTSRDGSQIYIILNYNEFQVVGLPKCDTDETAVATQVRHECDKEETLKHSIDISLGARVKKSSASEPPELPDWLDREAWTAFLDMRTKKKTPNTARALRIILKKLDKWRGMGRDPTAILDASTVNGWKDLYEPKDQLHGQRNSTARTSTDQHLSGIIDLRNEIRGRSFGT